MTRLVFLLSTALIYLNFVTTADFVLPQANELAEWLLSEPACPPLCAAGAHIILAHAPGDPHQYVDHAERVLEIYKDVEKTISTEAQDQDRVYINWALDRAKRVLAETQERLAQYLVSNDSETDEAE